MSNRKHNFCAGPCTLPIGVLEEMRDEFLDYHGAGLSLIEMSHRAAEYDAVHQEARRLALEVFGAPEDFDVLFIQGGAILQFGMVAMNLLGPGRCAGYVNTGAWAKGAIADARHYGEIYTAWDGAADGYARTPDDSEIEVRDGTRYLHVTSNETIGGIRFPGFPVVDVPLVADVSSEMMARRIPWERFDLVYGGVPEEPRPGRDGDGLHPEVGRDAGQRIHRPLPALRRPPRQGVAVQHPSDVHHRDGRQGAEVDEGQGWPGRHRTRGGGEGDDPVPADRRERWLLLLSGGFRVAFPHERGVPACGRSAGASFPGRGGVRGSAQPQGPSQRGGGAGRASTTRCRTTGSKRSRTSCTGSAPGTGKPPDGAQGPARGLHPPVRGLPLGGGARWRGRRTVVRLPDRR